MPRIAYTCPLKGCEWSHTKVTPMPNRQAVVEVNAVVEAHVMNVHGMNAEEYRAARTNQARQEDNDG